MGHAAATPDRAAAPPRSSREDAVAAGRAWRWYLALGLLACGAYLLVPPGAARDTSYLLVGLSAIGAKLAGVRCHRPTARLPWGLIISGGLLLAAGSGLDIAAGPHPPPADPAAIAAQAAYVGSYLLLGGGVILLVGRHTRGADRGALLDALLVTTGAGLAGWLLLGPAGTHPRTPGGADSPATLVYPLLDLLLLAILARLAFAPTARVPATAFLSVGLALGLLADTTRAALQLAATPPDWVVLDAVWLLSYVLWGAAALHPSMRALSARAARPLAPPRLTRARLVFLAAVLLIGPAALAIQASRGERINVPALVGGWVALWALALARLVGLTDLLGAALDRNVRAVARERALRRASAALVAATDRGAIQAAVVEGTLALARPAPGARACLALRAGSAVAVAAAGGAHAAPPVGATLDLRALPVAARAALQDRRPATLDPALAAAVWAAFGARGSDGPLFVVPLPRGEGRWGMLLAGGPSWLGSDFAGALAILGAQATLALERADLAAALQARRSEERFRALVQHASDLIAVVAADGTIRYVSPAITRVLGYTDTARPAGNAFALLHPDDRDKAHALRAAALTTVGSVAPVELRARHRDGTWRYLEIIATDLRGHPDVGGVVLNSRDVTERRALEDRLGYQARHDPLTGLPNRAQFLERVEEALARGRAAVLFLDLDRFKVVNDSLGHAVGDRLLVDAADRLRACGRPGDLLARLGGDEFTVLLAPGSGLAAARAAADRVVAALAAPFAIDGHEIAATASVGLALGERGRHAAELVRDADVAMYQAKQAGKSRYVVHDGSMRAAALLRLELEGDLRRALERAELRVYYQPKVALASGRIAGFEALVRWQHPTRGLLPPGVFISLAEETGLIVPLGRWVLAAACTQAATWRARYPTDNLLISVNISVRQLQQPRLAEEVAAILRDTGLSPGALKLELTESVLMDDSAASARTVRELRRLGVQLILDDFGTGYSSLSYLKRLPLAALKIDRSFVGGLGADPEDTAIVRAVVSLARALDLLVVAEGVETAAQAAALRRLGCDLGQGTLFAAPVPAAAAAALLAREAAGPLATGDPAPPERHTGPTP